MPRLHSPTADQKTGLHCFCLHSLLLWHRVPINTASVVRSEQVFRMTLTVHWLGQDTSSTTSWNKPEASSVSAAYLSWGKIMQSHAWARWKLLLKARRVSKRSLATAAVPLEPETEHAASANRERHLSSHRRVHSRSCVPSLLRILVLTGFYPYLALGVSSQTFNPARTAIPEPMHSPAAKRSYKRAVKRASRFGVTTYLGRTFTAKQLSVRYQPDNAGSKSSSPQVETTAHGLRILYWNAGGLHASRHAELKHWLHIQDEHTRPDLVVITETHWPTTMEYPATDWQAVHTGVGQSQGGILVLVHNSVCPAHDIRYNELKPGRLLHVRISLQKRPALDVLAVYQHAWNPDSGDGDRQARITRLLANRSDIWERISKWARSVPARNLLLIVGDMNCPLLKETTHVGKGTPILPAGHHYRDQFRLQDLLRDHGLCALNTWGKAGSPSVTFKPLKGMGTQIDFYLTRCRQTTPQALCASTLMNFPLLPETGMYHLPVKAQLPLPVAPRKAGEKQGNSLKATQELMNKYPKLLPTYQAHLPDHVLPHQELTKIMADAWANALDQCCVILNPSEAPATTLDSPEVVHLWQHRQELRALQQALATNHDTFVGTLDLQVRKHTRARLAASMLLRAWQQAVHCTRKAKELRKISRLRKKQHLDALIMEARNSSSPMTAVHQILKRYAPKVRQKRLQLRTSQGHILTPQEEMQQIVGHFKQVYKQPDHAPSGRPVDQAVVFDPHSVLLAFSKLPNKALPSHFLPAPLWRASAHLATQVFQQTLVAAYDQEELVLPKAWHEIQVALIPKPSKPATSADSLRPISLLSPMAKVLAKLVAEEIRPIVSNAATHIPQFAYLEGRQTCDAIDRAFGHCREIRERRQNATVTTRDRRAGKTAQIVSGGVTLSLDLRKAFDSIPWQCLQQCLEHFRIPASIIQLILYLHENATYIFKTPRAQGSVLAGQGIRQGCGLAPMLWTLYSLYLASKLDTAAPSALKTFFADDFLAQWTIETWSDMKSVPTQISKIVAVLEDHGMQLSPGKTVVLYSLWGTQVHACLKPTLCQHATLGKCLRIGAANLTGKCYLLPVVMSHEYLGVKLSYKNFEWQTLKHRLRHSWIAYNRLSALLKSKALPVHKRLQLHQCICLATLRYGLSCTGLTMAGRQKVYGTVLRQWRALANNLPHITGLSNATFLTNFHLADPLEGLDTTLIKRLDKVESGPIAQLQPPVVKRWWEHLRKITNDPTVTQAASKVPLRHQDARPPAPCDVCGLSFPNEATLRWHISNVHVKLTKEQHHAKEAAFRERKASHTQHAHDGMPTCRHCRHEFSSWPQFAAHHNRQCCPVLHLGCAPTLPPYPPDPAPLLQDEAFLQDAQSDDWKQLAQNIRAIGRLHYCPFCNLWMAKTAMLHQHIKAQHVDAAAHLDQCQHFLLTRKGINSPCQHCGTRHNRAAVGCSVLIRVAFILQHQNRLGILLHASESATGDDGRADKRRRRNGSVEVHDEQAWGGGAKAARRPSGGPQSPERSTARRSGERQPELREAGQTGLRTFFAGQRRGRSPERGLEAHHDPVPSPRMHWPSTVRTPATCSSDSAQRSHASRIEWKAKKEQSPARVVLLGCLLEAVTTRSGQTGKTSGRLSLHNVGRRGEDFPEQGRSRIDPHENGLEDIATLPRLILQLRVVGRFHAQRSEG